MKTRSVVAAAILIGAAATASLAQVQSDTYYLSKGQVQSELSLNNHGFQTYAAAVKNFKGKIVVEYDVMCAGANNVRHNGRQEDEVQVNARVDEGVKANKKQALGWYIDAETTGGGQLNNICQGGAEVVETYSRSSTLVLTVKAEGFADIDIRIPLD
jgi:hypothetical protein